MRSTLEEVKYESARIKISTAIGKLPTADADNGILQTLRCTKARHWAYEEELRRVIKLNEAPETGSTRFFTFDDTLRLAEVIVGENCSLDYRNVRALVNKGYERVTVYKARSAWGYFSMVPDERTVP